MKKKYNNNSLLFADWTTAKLKSEAKAYYFMVNVEECYSTKDAIMLEALLGELARRGVEAKTDLVF